MSDNIRFTSATNPLGLVLGERIKAKRICEVAYNENNERRLFFTGKMTTPVSCIVVGVAKKALGTYHKGHRRDHMGLEYDDDPPRLDVFKYVRLYECRTSIDKPIFLVHPDDVLKEV